jgi:hypothetical protein
MLFFGNSITSRVEGGHVKLKRALETSIEDLKKVINVIDLLLKDQRSAYIIAHEKFKSRLARECTIEALQNLQGFYSSYALRLIRKQLNKLNSSDALSSCTGAYRSSMSLSCAHEIQANPNLLHGEDVHSHWQIYDYDVNRNRRDSKSKIADEDMRDDNHQKGGVNQKGEVNQKGVNQEEVNQKEVNQEEVSQKEVNQEEDFYQFRETQSFLSDDDDDLMKEFSLDSVLTMKESKKMKKKGRLLESQNKVQKRVNNSTRRDSFDHEYVEAEIDQRGRERGRDEKTRERGRSRTQTRDDEGERGREDERTRGRERGRERLIESADVDEMSSGMTSLLQF